MPRVAGGRREWGRILVSQLLGQAECLWRRWPQKCQTMHISTSSAKLSCQSSLWRCLLSFQSLIWQRLPWASRREGARRRSRQQWWKEAKWRARIESRCTRSWGGRRQMRCHRSNSWQKTEHTVHLPTSKDTWRPSIKNEQQHANRSTEFETQEQQWNQQRTKRRSSKKDKW